MYWDLKFSQHISKLGQKGRKKLLNSEMNQQWRITVQLVFVGKSFHLNFVAVQMPLLLLAFFTDPDHQECGWGGRENRKLKYLKLREINCEIPFST